MAEQSGQGMTVYQQRALEVSGAVASPQEATNRLQYARDHLHLVSPAAQVGHLPEGCEVVLAAVSVEPGRDTYPIQGSDQLGLGKPALDKIAAGVGVTWDPTQSGRLDDATHPHYCRWRAVGHYRAFDGQAMTIVGEKEVDLRDGSPQTEGWKTKRLAQAREHIQSLAETKARLRAIRTLGIQTSYHPAELQKPFVTARVMFTGRTADPELRKEFARMSAQSFLGGASALYGGDPSRMALPEPVRHAGHAPPPVGTALTEDEEIGALPPPAADPAPAPSREPERAERPAPPPVRPAPQAPAVDPSQFTIPGGKAKGTPLPQAQDRDLRYWEGRIADGLEEDPDGRFADKDRRLLSALRAELARREQGPADIEF